MEHKAILSSFADTGIKDDAIAAARQEGCIVKFDLPYGLLISGSRRQLARLEKKGYRVKILSGTDLLEVGEYRIKTEGSEKVESSLTLEQEEKWSHYLVQLIAPPALEWVDELIRMGLDVVEPVSAYGLFVVCGGREIAEAAKLSFVAWTGPFLPAYRIHGSLKGVSGNVKYLSIAVYPPRGLDIVADEVTRAGGSVARKIVLPGYYRSEYGELLVETDASVIDRLARLPEVRWLEYAPPRPYVEGEREAQIVAGNVDSTPYPDSAPLPGYDGWLQGLGLEGGSGVTVAICDSGVDANIDNNKTGHTDLRGRQHSFIDYSNEEYPAHYLTHGTHVAALAVGDAANGQKDDDGFLWGQGVAPRANYINQNILVGPWPPDWAAVVRDAAVRRASVINNSWCTGRSPGEGYTLPARTFDRLVRDAIPGVAAMCPITVVFSAGNVGPGDSSITPPKEAKNTIVVGNSLTYRPHTRFCCGDIRGIFGASSRGPARDGRLLPTLVAPGTDVSAAMAGVSRHDSIADTGEPDCDNPARRLNEYVYMTGTSMSAALVSGACAMLTEWWRRRTGGCDPSPALLKALLINGAEDQAGGQDWRCLNGNSESNSRWECLDDDSFCRPLDFLPLILVSGKQRLSAADDKENLQQGEWHYSSGEKMLYVRTMGCFDPRAPGARLLNALAPQPLGHMPDNTQGWGRVSLNNILLQFPASARGNKIIIDGEHHFTASGQEFVIRVTAVDIKMPLRVTLAWTDAPAAVGSGRTLVNDLDLEVRKLTGRRLLYKGNVITRGYSRTGADYDSVNNVECVYLREPQGIYEIRVVAANLRALAKPPFGCIQQWQDFSLVIDNAEEVNDDAVGVVPVLEQCTQSEHIKKNYLLKIACKQLLVSLRPGDRVGLAGALDGVLCPADPAKAIQMVMGKSMRRNIGVRILIKRKPECISQNAGVAAAQELLTMVDGRKAVLLFSGNRENTCSLCTGERFLYRGKADAAVHTCALGSWAQHRELVKLAASSGGNYYYVPNMAFLAEVCNYLRADITGESVVLNETRVANNSSSAALVDDGAEQVTFVFSWPNVPLKLVFDPQRENEISIRLRAPDGRYIHPNSSWLYRQQGTGHVIFRIRKPPPGIWQLEMLTSGIDMQYTVSAFVKSDLRLFVEAPGLEHSLIVNASMKEKGKPVVNWRATAGIIVSSADSCQTVLLRECAQGNWQTATIMAPAAEPFNVVVRADGISPFTGAPFCRYRLVSVPRQH